MKMKDKLIDEINAIEADAPHWSQLLVEKENERYYYDVDAVKGRSAETEFMSEIDSDIKREARMAYLEEKLIMINDRINNLDTLIKKHEMNKFLEDELVKTKSKYKKLYLEYGSLKAYETNVSGMLPETELERIRLVPIISLLASQMNNAGRDRKRTICPFHKEKDGSFFIYPDNSYYCFGCGKHGQNAIDFIMQLNSSDFMGAIEYLRYR